MKRHLWLVVAASSAGDSESIYSDLKGYLTTWAQINTDSNGNVTYHIITTETGLAPVKRYLTKKSNKEALGIMQSGVLENNVQKGWPRKKSSSVTTSVEQKVGSKKQTAFQRLIRQIGDGIKKERSEHKNA